VKEREREKEEEDRAAMALFSSKKGWVPNADLRTTPRHSEDDTQASSCSSSGSSGSSGSSRYFGSSSSPAWTFDPSRVHLNSKTPSNADETTTDGESSETTTTGALSLGEPMSATFIRMTKTGTLSHLWRT